MEAFELTFYIKRENDCEETLSLFKSIFRKANIDKISFIQEKREYIDKFDYKENDFIYYTINFFGMNITEENFQKINDFIINFTKEIFLKTHNVNLATGIYEMTDYQLTGIKNMLDLESSIIEKFPYSFFKKEIELQDYIFTDIIYDDSILICNLNKKSQNLFSFTG